MKELSTEGETLPSGRLVTTPAPIDEATNPNVLDANKTRRAVSAFSDAPVTIVIPNLDSPIIGDVVGEVGRQVGQWAECPPIEVLVVGSDRRDLVAPAFARRLASDRVLGAAAARNIGVGESRGERIIFLDADCIPQPGWLQAMLTAMHDERVAVSGAIEIVPDTLMRVAGNVASFHAFTTKLPADERRFLATYSLGLSRSAFDEVGWFDESLPRSEDLDFTIRLAQAGYRLRFEPSATVIHRPARVTLRSLLRHAYRSGASSIVVRRRYRRVFAMPALLFHWPILTLLAPLLAGVVTIRALRQNSDVSTRGWTLPTFYLSRLAWCLGAAGALWKEKPNGVGEMELKIGSPGRPGCY